MIGLDLATYDCSVPGCPSEARQRGGLCTYHATTTDRPRPVAPGSHAHLMEEETPVNTCKVESCTNPSAGKGGQCENVAQAGSVYCYQHDPATKLERDRQAAEMRSRQTRELATVPWADVHARIAPWLQTEQHPAQALNAATGVAHAVCSRLLLGRYRLVTPSMAARLLSTPESPGRSVTAGYNPGADA